MTKQLSIETNQTSQPGVTTIVLTGSLTLETVTGFNHRMREETASVLLLDLTKVEWLDSAGVGALVQLLVRRAKGKGSLALAGLTSRSNAVLQVAHVLNLFSVFPTVEDAHSYFAQHGSLSSDTARSA
jgi:anti-anti-sigma factor